ncbi:MAG: alpha-galactosidase [Solirubrobacterales bacterium]|nr:alpha-galactosidase [Solirubrobacterales bacterium]
MRFLRELRAAWLIAIVIGGLVVCEGVTVSAARASTGKTAVQSRVQGVSGPVEARFAPPPLGWDSWNAFMNSINASVIEENARALVSSGLAAAGYRYVNIDEGWWTGKRDARGNIVVNEKQWPGGMAAMARRIHALGLKAGIYTDVGKNGCGYYYPQTGPPEPGSGSEGHYDQDMLQFARWGFDYVKVDWCGGDKEGLDAQVAYTQIAVAIARAEAITGRHMIFSICNWGRQDPWVWGPATGDLWRVSGDISYVPSTATFAGVLTNADTNAPLAEFQHNGRYNDPDMMEVGASGLSAVEDRAHLSLWAVMGAPMILGNDLRTMSPELARLIGNRQMLAVDQDPLGLQGYVVSEDDAGRQVWAKTLYGSGRRAVVLLNRGVQPASVTVRWSDLGLAAVRTIHDVWANRDMRVAGSSSYTALVRPHGAVMLIVNGTDRRAIVLRRPRRQDGSLTFEPIPSVIDGFTVAYLRFSNATRRPQTLMLADNSDPASMITLPATGGQVRAAAMTLQLHTGPNSVTISNVSTPRLRVHSLALMPRPALPPRFLAADPSSQLSGGAQTQSCPSCPSDADVGDIGSGQTGTDGVLTMHVDALHSGRQLLSIWYVNGDVARTFALAVNNQRPQQLVAASTFSWSTVGSVRVLVRLHAGDNTLTFSNHGGHWAPDVAAVVMLPPSDDVPTGPKAGPGEG